MSTTVRQRVGDWCQTYTGRVFWPLDPDPAEIDPRDIAHALAMQCRYGGHALRFYSVAEHSVLVSRAVPPEHALWGLLHDAAEAYLVDVPRPVKAWLREYAIYENNLLFAVARRFGLPAEMPSEVKEADDRMLATERPVVMAPCAERWYLPAEPYRDVALRFWGPGEAEALFVARFIELGGVL